MVKNLKETGTPFAYKKVDFGKKVRKIIAPDRHRADDKDMPGIMEGYDQTPGEDRYIEKTFEDSDE